MCGIVVVLCPQRPSTVATIVAMTDALHHRGPDDEGFLALDGDRVLRLAGRDTPAAVREMPTPSQPQALARDEGERTSRLLMGHRRLSIVDLSPLGLNETDEAFCRRIVNDYKVAAIPVSAFYEQDAVTSVVRFCFAKKDATLDTALERLADAVHRRRGSA